MDNPKIGQIIGNKFCNGCEWEIVKIDEQNDNVDLIIRKWSSSRYNAGDSDVTTYKGLINSTQGWILIKDIDNISMPSVWLCNDDNHIYINCKDNYFLILYKNGNFFQGQRFKNDGNCLGTWINAEKELKSNFSLCFEVGQKWKNKGLIFELKEIDEKGVITGKTIDVFDSSKLVKGPIVAPEHYSTFLQNWILISDEVKGLIPEPKKIECPSCHFKHEKNYLGFMTVECLNPNCQHFHYRG